MDGQAVSVGSTHSLDIAALLRAQVREIHSQLDEGFTEWLRTLAPASPPRGSPVVALYVHAATIEDVTLHSLLLRVAPLYETHWAGKGPANYSPSDLAPLRAYASQVFGATEVYLAKLAPDEANHTVDLTRLAHGQPTVAWVITNFVVLQLARIHGELSGHYLAMRSRAGSRTRRVAVRTDGAARLGE